MDRMTLKQAFPNWLSGGGIFSALQEFNVPWKDESISSSLDIEYHGNRSNGKLISPLVESIISGTSLSDMEVQLLATTIFNLFNPYWIKEWATLSAVYDPIENYSMTEVMTNDQTVDVYGKTETTTNDLTHTKTGDETNTPDITETQTPELTTTRNDSVFGFNSENASPSGSQTNTAGGTNTSTRTGNEKMEYNVTDSDTGTSILSHGGEDTRTRNYTLLRTGNIGVTTSQQMLESERNLWYWNFFYDVVFPNVDKILTLQIY